MTYHQHCGNGIVERGEECDCQTVEVFSTALYAFVSCIFTWQLNLSFVLFIYLFIVYYFDTVWHHKCFSACKKSALAIFKGVLRRGLTKVSRLTLAAYHLELVRDAEPAT